MTEAELSRLVDDLSLQERVALLSGQDFWSVAPNARAQIGALRVSDGPNGARGAGSFIGGVTSAAFPVGIAIGASWNPDLAHEIGVALADEVKSKGAHVLLAPTVNIHRSVTNGRNFECYAEDPELTAALAVAYISGLQSQGIGATIKHFAGNESEIERTTMSSEIDERPLREIYLRPFEDAVKKAGTWAIMSSYNKINGIYAAEHHWLLTQVLRQEWGYDGVVMSDWFGSRSTEPTINAGLDLEMPGPTRDRGEKLVAAAEAGRVTADTLRERALNMLRLMDRTGSLRDFRAHQETATDQPQTRALIRRAGAEGMVLLKNERVLPLDPSGKGKIAVIGPNAKSARIMGGGSAQLNPHYMISPWQGLAAKLGEDRLIYAEGCTNQRWEPLLTGPMLVEYFPQRGLQGGVIHSETLTDAIALMVPPIAGGKVAPDDFSARITGSFTARETGMHRVGIHATGPCRLFVDGKLAADATHWIKGRTFFEEGNDEVAGEVMLQAGKTCEVVFEFNAQPGVNLQITCFRVGIGHPLGDADIAQAALAAKAAETALVFVGRNGEWDTEGSDLEHISLPGRQDELVAAVLAANPNTIVVLQTGGPVEMPWMEDAPAILQAWYPGQECGNAIADVLFGDAEPGGRLPQTFPKRWQDNPTRSQDPQVYPGLDGKVRYAEGVFIGHRHYDKQGIAPMFSFGHGLSYTRFALADLAVETGDDGARITATLCNTGDRAGSTVVQAYLGEINPTVPRPLRELKGFQKLWLDPGESRKVSIALPMRAFAHWDQQGQQWRANAGAYRVELGFSSADLPLAAEIQGRAWACRP